MQFDKKTKDILTNFSSINPSIHVQKGKELQTLSHNRTIFARAVVDVEFDSEFCVYDLSRFLTTLSLFESPEMVITKKEIIISQGLNRVKYVCSSPDTIVKPNGNRRDFGDVAVTFTLSNATLVQVLKGAGVLKLSHIRVVGADGAIKIEAFDNKDRITDKFEIEIGETDKEFSIVYDIETFKLLPIDYNVHIHRVEGLPIAVFKSSAADTEIEYVIALDHTSQF